MVNVEVTGDRELRIYFDKISDEMKPALRRAAGLSLLLLKERVQRKLSGQVLHRQTGALVGSVAIQKFSGGSIGGRVGPNKVYAAIHEFGGMAGRGHSVTIPPRPYMQPAFEENISRITELFEKEIDKVLKK